MVSVTAYYGLDGRPTKQDIQAATGRWWAMAERELWDRYAPDTAARCEAALCLIIRRRVLDTPRPSLSQFIVSQGHLVEWGACPTIEAAGAVLSRLEAAGLLDRSPRSHSAWWWLPLRAWHDRAGESIPVPAAPNPLMLYLMPPAWSVWWRLPRTGGVTAAALCERLNMAGDPDGDIRWTLEDDLPDYGLVRRSAAGWCQVPFGEAPTPDQTAMSRRALEALEVSATLARRWFADRPGAHVRMWPAGEAGHPGGLSGVPVNPERDTLEAAGGE